MLIDTHCHLNLQDKFPEVGATVSEAIEVGVSRFIVVGVDVATSVRALELADEFVEVYGVVGVHPNYSNAYQSSQIKEIERLLKHPKAVAIGEVGLDRHWHYATDEQQKAALFDQLDLAEATGKPVVFHCREAYPALLDLLEKRRTLPWLFHCFAGDAEDARRAVALDAYFGVDGPITYPKSEDLRAIVQSLPRDRIVIETDAPYLTPVPFRGKPNKPAYVLFVNAALASCLGCEQGECALLTTANAERFFGLGAS